MIPNVLPQCLHEHIILNIMNNNNQQNNMNNNNDDDEWGLLFGWESMPRNSSSMPIEQQQSNSTASSNLLDSLESLNLSPSAGISSSGRQTRSDSIDSVHDWADFGKFFD